MTESVLVLVFLAVALHSVRAVDLDKLPPMNDTKYPADLELKGRELEAIDVALRRLSHLTSQQLTATCCAFTFSDD